VLFRSHKQHRTDESGRIRHVKRDPQGGAIATSPRNSISSLLKTMTINSDEATSSTTPKRALGQHQKPQRECEICKTNFPPGEGISCSRGKSNSVRPHTSHFVCKDCFENYVNAESDKDTRIIQKMNCQLHCPQFQHGCDESSPYEDHAISKLVSQKTFDKYIEKFKVQPKEARLIEEMEKKKEADRIREQSMDEVQKLRLKIIEDILTLKCPRCKSAFSNFDGCLALRCHRCPCAFCALCQEDCGNDAHAHAANCQYNQSRNVHLSEAMAQAIWTRVKQARMVAFYQSGAVKQDQNFRKNLARALENDLRGTGVVLPQ